MYFYIDAFCCSSMRWSLLVDVFSDEKGNGKNRGHRAGIFTLKSFYFWESVKAVCSASQISCRSLTISSSTRYSLQAGYKASYKSPVTRSLLVAFDQ